MRRLCVFTEPETIIYFVQLEKIGPIKIGTASNLHKRLYYLQTANPYKINVLYCYEGAKEDEASWHKYFIHYNIKGEWFHPDKSIFDEIENMKNFDIKNGNMFFFEGIWKIDRKRDFKTENDLWLSSERGKKYQEWLSAVLN